MQIRHPPGHNKSKERSFPKMGLILAELIAIIHPNHKCFLALARTRASKTELLIVECAVWNGFKAALNV